MTLSRDIKQRIVTLVEHTSKSLREIALELSISRSAVQKTLAVWRETGSVEEHKEESRGRKEKLTAREKKNCPRLDQRPKENS